MYVIPGSIVVADNVLSFGQPLDKYLQHVRDKSVNGLYNHSELHKCYLEYSTAKAYSDRHDEIHPGSPKDLDTDQGTEKEETMVDMQTEFDIYGGRIGEKQEVDGLEISIFR